MEHQFTPTIHAILDANFGQAGQDIFKFSNLIQYLNIKTRSASRGSKSRGSFANIYAIYVLIEDYLAQEFDVTGTYEDYEGAQYSDLFLRQRQLPFGNKLQNHALNHRLNQEFIKYFPQNTLQPILRDTTTSRYWINEHLIQITIDNQTYNLAKSILKIIDAYIETKQGAFNAFIKDMENLFAISNKSPEHGHGVISKLLHPNVDARIFEIVSFAILKIHYLEQSIYWGWTRDELNSESLSLYKTGRTNANDGGIDFVMKPLGRFFQVTETSDVKKYFLDIDKVQHYPISFVIKSIEPIDTILQQTRFHAEQIYPIKIIVDRYMSAIEEIINIPRLSAILSEQIQHKRLEMIVREILLHSKIEFNYSLE